MPILLKYGAFLQTLFDFLIIAFVLFLALKGINKLKKPAAPACECAAAAAAAQRSIAGRDPRSAEEIGKDCEWAPGQFRESAIGMSANAVRVRFSWPDGGYHHIVLDADSAISPERIHERPVDGACMGPALQSGEQAVR